MAEVLGIRPECLEQIRPSRGSEEETEGIVKEGR